GTLQPIVEKLAIPPELDAPMLLLAIAVGGYAKDELPAGRTAEPGSDAGVCAGRRLIVDVSIGGHQGRQQTRRTRMEEPQARNTAVARVRGDGRDPVDLAARTLAFIVHDHRDLMPEVAPRARQQHMLDRLAADVLRIRITREHAERIEPDDADAVRDHG